MYVNKLLKSCIGAFLWVLSLYSFANSEEVIDLSSPVIETVGSIEFRECMLESQGRDRTVQCAWYEMLEDYTEPEGKKIQLFIARIPAKKSRKAPDPMLFLAGGPGGAASDSYLHFDRPFEELSKDRDFYLIDQRGTGHSNRLDCDKAKEGYEERALRDYSLLDPDLAAQEEFLQACFDELTADPRFYTTSVAIRDFEGIRDALDIQQWNLFGVSYGTRVAIHYMRRYPDSVRTALLDSAVPPDRPLLEEVAINSQKVLSSLYQQCTEDAECEKRFPNLENQVTKLLSSLDKAPIEVRVENFRTGEVEEVPFSKAHLVFLIRLYLYRSDSLSLLPPLLHEAATKNNFSSLARASTTVMSSLDQGIALGMGTAVHCAEDVPFIEWDESKLQEAAETYMGIGAQPESREVIACKIWPQGVMDADFKEPLLSNIPTLIVSGEFDPITPPEYGDQLLEGLSNAKHLVLKGQGHGASIKGCAPRLVEKFVSDASMELLNTRCLERLSAAPLYINFNGPMP